MDAKIEIAQVNGQALSNSVVGDVLIYATSNLQNVLVGQSNSLPALRCQGANVSTGANLTVAGNINIMGSILQSNAPLNMPVPTNTGIVYCQVMTSSGGYWDYGLSNGTAVSSPTINTWTQRAINTIAANTGANIDSVANNQMWLKGGTYVIEWSVPVVITNGTFTASIGPTSFAYKTRLRNVTTGTDVAYGKHYMVPVYQSPIYQIDAKGTCIATVSGASNAFEIGQTHNTPNASGVTTIGGMRNTATPVAGLPDIYTEIKVTRIG